MPPSRAQGRRANARTSRDGDGRPLDALPVTVDGSPASSTDLSTWAALPQAESSDVGEGLGFALGDGFACIDLDHCYDERNHLTPWAKMLIAPVADSTWIEISPSGNGLHIWGRCGERTGLKVRNDLGMNIEAYSQGRYMTYTGHRFRKSPAKLADLTFLFDVIAHLA